VQPGGSKEEYEALILSEVLGEKVQVADVKSPKYGTFVSSFAESREKGTISFEWQDANGRTGNTPTMRVTVGVPEWLGAVLSGKGGISVGPGASLQNCPNGICIGGENSGTATVINEAPKPEFTAALRVVPSDREGYIKTEIRVTPNVAIPPPIEMVLDFDNPVIQIGGYPEGAAAVMGGGAFRYGTHTLTTVQSPGINPRHPLLLIAYSLKPLTLVKPPYLEGQN
jgi:hypothetical protein